MEQAGLLMLGNYSLDGLSSLVANADNIVVRRTRLTTPSSITLAIRTLERRTVKKAPLKYVLACLTDDILLAISSHQCTPDIWRLLDLIVTFDHALIIDGSTLSLRKEDLQPNSGPEREWAWTWWSGLCFQNHRMPLDGIWAGRMIAVLATIKSEGYHVVPYDEWHEAPMLAQKALRDKFSGTIFEVFVPKEHLLAEEFDRFVTLFCQYLNRIRGVEVTVNRDDRTTSVMYRFGSNSLDLKAFSMALDDFKDFLFLLEGGPHRVKDMVSAADLSDDQVSRILQGFDRDWRRLRHDMVYSLRRTFLDLEEKYSSAMLDAMDETAITSMEPLVIDPLRYLPLGNMTVITQSLDMQIGGRSMRIGKLENKGGQNIFADTISHSTFAMTEDAQKLLEAIEKYAPSADKPLLTNSVEMLEDKGARTEEKLSAKARIQEFIFKQVLPKVGEEGAKLLFAVLQKKYLGS